MTRVKICGVRDRPAAEAAARAGADALGLVFYAPSPRSVDIETASAIVRDLAPLMTTVGLFVDPSVEQVEAVLERCPLDCLQFHGGESAAFCESFGRPYLRAVSMRPKLDVAALVEAHRGARAFLFDAWREDAPGGTGETFAWERIPPMQRPWLLAGGLTPANVGDAIRRVRPPAVDVSGGVERERGIKDAQLIRAFIAAVRSADRELDRDGASGDAFNQVHAQDPVDAQEQAQNQNQNQAQDGAQVQARQEIA